MHRVWAYWQHGWDTVWPLAMRNYSFLHYSLCLLHILVHQTEQSTQTAPLFLLWESGRDTRKGWVCQRVTKCYLCYQFTYLMKRNIKAHLIQLSVPEYPKCRALCKKPQPHYSSCAPGRITRLVTRNFHPVPTSVLQLQHLCCLWNNLTII